LINCQKAITCYRTSTNNPARYSDQDSILLAWDFRSNYKGKYYVVVMNLFEDHVLLMITDEKELVLNLKPLKTERDIIYKVISEDCFESELIAIHMK